MRTDIGPSASKLEGLKITTFYGEDGEQLHLAIRERERFTAAPIQGSYFPPTSNSHAELVFGISTKLKM